MKRDDTATRVEQLFHELGIDLAQIHKGELRSHSPIDGRVIGAVDEDSADVVARAVDDAHAAYLAWRLVPAPRRGELVRRFGDELRRHKHRLGQLVSIETGKILSEGLGEVQEMIDICDFAVGLSRQLYGLTIATERAGHRMMETWHPLGVVGIISAFNFPVAVWAWNACLALVCGNAVVWKPSEKTPVTAVAVHALLARIIGTFPDAPGKLSLLVHGRRDTGEALADNPRVPLVSATGSTRMGRELAPKVAARFGRSLLELGGNNAMILAPSADLELAIRAIAFSAVGTTGQRCTTLRRLFIHSSLAGAVVERLINVFASVKVGDPLLDATLVGPLIDEIAYSSMQEALHEAAIQGGVVHGGKRVDLGHPEAYYVAPALVEMPEQSAVVCTETFAPILYVMTYDDLDAAIALHNDVPQGLSSAIFTSDIREAEYFISAAGSDCGIANINIGPSGAEIGGAFGGEKETGGGRESGSDSWRAYMRRATNTVNYSRALPLAQGVEFAI